MTAPVTGHTLQHFNLAKGGGVKSNIISTVEEMEAANKERQQRPRIKKNWISVRNGFRTATPDRVAIYSNKVAVIDGDGRTTLNGLKLFFVVLSEVYSKEDQAFASYYVSRYQLSHEALGLDYDLSKAEIYDLVKSVTSCRLQVHKDGGGYKLIPWMTIAGPDDSEHKRIEFKINPELKPYLLGEVGETGFTQAFAASVRKLKSLLQIRLYLELRRYAGLRQRWKYRIPRNQLLTHLRIPENRVAAKTIRELNRLLGRELDAVLKNTEIGQFKMVDYELDQVADEVVFTFKNRPKALPRTKAPTQNLAY